MEYADFTEAYINNDKEAMKIGLAVGKCLPAITDKKPNTKLWLDLCDVAWAEYQEKNQPE